MKNKHYVVLLSVILFLVQGCIANKDKGEARVKGSVNEVPHSTRSKDDQFIQRLAELKQQNPVKDAQQAIANGNKQFIAPATRGGGIPGIDSNQYSILKRKCGLRYKEGFGDILYGKHHQRYYDALFSYAKEYNKTILRGCR
jgi:hypothetical protein